MKKQDTQMLKRIYQYTCSVLKYCESCRTNEEFEADSMRVDACLYNLVQIGEFQKCFISDETKAELPNIPWDELYSASRTIVHFCRYISMWGIISEKLPLVKKELEEYLKNAE